MELLTYSRIRMYWNCPAIEQLRYRSPDDIKDFRRELWDITQRLAWDKQQGIFLHNTARSTDFERCEYMPICRRDQWQGMYEYRKPHPELSKGARNHAFTQN